MWKERNERVKVSLILDFGSFTRRGLLADFEHPAEIWVGQIADSSGRRLKRRQQKTERPPTCLR